MSANTLTILTTLMLLICVGCTSQNHMNNPASLYKPPPERVLTGNWLVTFQVNTKAAKSNMHLVQYGNQFTGVGTDEDGKLAYTIKDGVVDGNQVYFQKVYAGADHTSPPIEYTGQYQMLNTNGVQPYMEGQYTTLFKGQRFSDSWKAHMAQSPDKSSITRNTASSIKTPEHAPDISGKWKMGYEYNFGIIKSIMFLQQKDGKLIGYGTKSGTTSQFNIKKGWYSYPKVTFMLEYARGGGNSLNQPMTFKGELTTINESDYQGLYLSGKTQGGGNWEAEKVK